MSVDVDIVVVGAGVVGLAIARSLSAQNHDVLVLECHDRVGTQTSSRNSEVIHAGLYYQPSSLRAKLCVRGNKLLYDFCAKNGVEYRRASKLLVATSDDQIDQLKAIQQRALQSGVRDLQWFTQKDAQALEPNLACVAACLSPSTGIVDSHQLMTALEGHISGSGGQVVLETTVTGVKRMVHGTYQLMTRSQGDIAAITCNRLVLANGLNAPALGWQLDYGGDYQPPQLYLAKGHYFTLQGAAPFSRHIYPMPVGAWLGVHLTLDVGGQTKFGPDIDWLPHNQLDAPDYKFDECDMRRQAFAREIKRYYPGLEDDLLQPGYTGIRPKIYAKGAPVADFAIDGPDQHGVAGLVALYGIESPGLTACLAIGDLVAARLMS